MTRFPDSDTRSELHWPMGSSSRRRQEAPHCGFSSPWYPFDQDFQPDGIIQSYAISGTLLRRTHRVQGASAPRNSNVASTEPATRTAYIFIPVHCNTVEGDRYTAERHLEASDGRRHLGVAAWCSDAKVNKAKKIGQAPKTLPPAPPEPHRNLRRLVCHRF